VFPSSKHLTIITYAFALFCIYQFRERYAGYKVPVASLKSKQMLKQLGILEAVNDLASRRTKSAAPDSETAAVVTATATTGEKGAATENEPKEDEKAVLLECAQAPPPTVSVVSKEQAMQLLKPDPREQAAATRTRSRSKSKDAIATMTPGNGNLKSEAGAEAETETGDSSLEGKFVNLVDLLLPVPSKGEFDVNKIKSSLYFFS